MIRILEDSEEPEVQHKAEVLCREWERCVHSVNRRRKELQRMLDDCRVWDNLRADLETWMTDAEQNRIAGKKVAECTLEELRYELKLMELLMPEIDEYKGKMHQLNEMSNRLIDQYSNDDCSTVSQTTSELNTQWSRLNDK